MQVQVSDREAAAAWYARVLGLHRDEHLAVWAGDPDGALMRAPQPDQPDSPCFAGLAPAMAALPTGLLHSA